MPLSEEDRSFLLDAVANAVSQALENVVIENFMRKTLEQLASQNLSPIPVNTVACCPWPPPCPCPPCIPGLDPPEGDDDDKLREIMFHEKINSYVEARVMLWERLKNNDTAMQGIVSIRSQAISQWHDEVIKP